MSYMQTRHTDREKYFWEQAVTSEKYFFPFIEKLKPLSTDTEVLEVGCGDGGNLYPFVIKNCKVTAVDRDPNRIQRAGDFFDSHGYKVRLLHEDIFMLADIGLFDIILMNDVIEHIPNPHKTKLLGLLKQWLKPNGIIFLGFPAWQMPFGGHQQICRNSLLAHLPFIHLLPLPLYKSLLKAFNEKENNIRELISIRESKITLEMYYRLVKQLGFKIMDERLYLINPHYEVKFKLKPKILPKAVQKVPLLRNFFTTACFAALAAEN